MLSALEKLFEKFSALTGLDPFITNLVLFVFACGAFLWAIGKVLFQIIIFLRQFFKQISLGKDLFPFFTKADIRKATKYYIETRYQNISPSEDEEPGSIYIASAKDKLQPLFLEKVFRYNLNDNKYFLILADSGMGKTTFLVNLYIRYKSKEWKNISLRKFKIKLVPIWHQKAFDYIDQIPDKNNTILLLDAFDEMIEAQQNHFKALKKILDKTDEFRIVVLTCRTQFFPSEQEEPKETGYFTAGESGEYHFQKAYLSVFDDRDVKKYLRKKYPFIWQLSKRKSGMKICKKSSSLMVRPMLLSYVDDLIKEEANYKYSFQVYRALINSWMRRESLKRAIKEKYKSDKTFFKALKIFSKRVALNMYENRLIRNGYHIPKSENMGYEFLKIEDISDGDVKLSDLDAKSKSLLNRNAAGDYKFSHKSILEYYLAEAIFNNELDFNQFDFTGMDMVTLFLKEMLSNKLASVEGSFKTTRHKSSIDELKLNQIRPAIFDEIVEMKINEQLNVNISTLSFMKNLRTLDLTTTTNFKMVHKLYWAVFIFYDSIYKQVNYKQETPKDLRPVYNEFIEKIKAIGCESIAAYLQEITFKKISHLVSTLKIEKSNFEMVNIESFIDSLDHAEIEKLKQLDGYYKNLHQISQNLPDCKVSF